MKTESLIREHDENTGRIGALLMYRDLVLNPEIKAENARLLGALGFDTLCPQGKEVWSSLVKPLSPADEAALLLMLRNAGVRLDSFLSAYCSAEGARNIRRALDLVLIEKPKAASPSLPINWRN